MVSWLGMACCDISPPFASNITSYSFEYASLAVIYFARGGYPPEVNSLIFPYELIKVIDGRGETVKHLRIL